MPPELPYLKETASQTAGPYVHIGLIPDMAGFDIYERNFSAKLAGPAAPGEPIVIEGRVLDGAGAPVRDALIEIWQADAAGRYDRSAVRAGKPVGDEFRGWGRSGTEFDSGLFRFETIKPGREALPRGGPSAPHINFWIVSRGVNIGLHTRMYFSDEEAANAADPVLNMIEQKSRRATLIAGRSQRAGKAHYQFDVRLQGVDETVFLDV